MGLRTRMSVEEMMRHGRSSEGWPGVRAAYCEAQGFSMSALYRMMRKVEGDDGGVESPKFRRSKLGSSSVRQDLL